MNIQQKLAENRWGVKIDFEIVSREPDQVVAKMPVIEEAKNPFGTMHAGALIWFADVTATLCAVRDLATVSESGAGFPLAIDLHTVLTGNEREGVLTAISKAVKRGRKIIIIRTEVRGESGQMLIDMTTTHLRSG